jgi:hypothetical protein
MHANYPINQAPPAGGYRSPLGQKNWCKHCGTTKCPCGSSAMGRYMAILLRRKKKRSRFAYKAMLILSLSCMLPTLLLFPPNLKPSLPKGRSRTKWIELLLTVGCVQLRQLSDIKWFFGSHWGKLLDIYFKPKPKVYAVSMLR